MVIFLASTLPTLLATQRGSARENSCHRVIIGLRDRVKLMIMTAGTTQREAHHGATDRVHLVIDAVKLKLFPIAFVQIHRPK